MFRTHFNQRTTLTTAEGRPLLGRTGIIETPHGTIKTPAFIPVGTRAAVRGVLPEAMKELGSQAILANAYHLFLQPGPEIIEKAGGLGEFMRWPHPTYTDSGGFQVLSLGSGFKKVLAMELSGTQHDDVIAANKERLAQVDEEGVTFRSHISGKKYRFTPEVSMQIQHQIGADIIFAFDELTTLLNTRTYQENSVARTHRWAQRCLMEHNRLDVSRSHHPPQSLWGVVQGAQYEDLRRQSARGLVQLSQQAIDKGSLGFGGFGIGGALEKQRLGTITEWVCEELPPHLPRHMLGISEPDDLFSAIEAGADTFDCVMPSRVARSGAVYTYDGRINLKNAQYKADFKPIEPEINNYSSQFSRAYLRHLLKAKETLAGTIATIHNEFFIVNLVDRIRIAIEEGTYWDFKAEFLHRYYRK